MKLSRLIEFARYLLLGAPPMSWWSKQFSDDSHQDPVISELQLNSLSSEESDAQTPQPPLTRAERRRLRRATQKYRQAHATRERIRVEAFNAGFANLRALLPTLPPNRKLSKIEILKLAATYISFLEDLLQI